MEQELKQPETEVKAVPIVVHQSAFPICRIDIAGSSLALPSDTLLCMKPVAKFDPKEPGMTRPDYSNQVKVQEIIESYKDQTGLAYALRQINAGRLLPSRLVDNDGLRQDVSTLPDNINDAYQATIAAGAQAKKVAQSLGLSYIDPAHIEELITDAINKKVAALSEKPNEVTNNE